MIKPKDSSYVDESLILQQELIAEFILQEEALARFYQIFDQYIIDEFSYGRIFTRESCLFALEEIINSPDIPERGIDIYSIDQYALFKYLLAVNDEIYRNANIPEGVVVFDYEELNPKTIALSESNVQINPILTTARAFKLCHFLHKHDRYGARFWQYMVETYNMSPYQFVFVLYEIYCINNNKADPTLDYIYYIDPNIYGDRFDRLSRRIHNEDTIRLVGIKKNPFYKVDDTHYVLLDNSFLILKGYTQLVNDFWFDCLKDYSASNKSQKNKYKEYMGDIGYFFEKIVDDTVKTSFLNYQNAKLLTFGDLKDAQKGCPEEIADLYLRHSNKVLIGQVKAARIYDSEKYKASLDGLYRDGRDKFFTSFGVKQIVDTLKLLDRHMPSFDPSYKMQSTLKIYPCIVVDDFALQTPLMADVFNKALVELIGKENFEHFNIKPLAIIHISDLEKMETSFIKDPSKIWDLLENNFEDSRFVPPFFSTVESYVKESLIPESVTQVINFFKLRYLTK